MNCCSLKPLMSGMVCCTTIGNLNNLCPAVYRSYCCINIASLTLSVDRNGTGELQYRTPECKEVECGALNRQASVRILALPLTSCDLGPATQPSPMYESNYMTLFFKRNRMRWRNFSSQVELRQERKELFIFFQLFCQKQSISDLAILSEYDTKIEELCLNYPLQKLMSYLKKM